MKKIALIALACLVALALHARPAAAFSGTELYQSCSGMKASDNNSNCAVYISGFIDGMIMGYTAHGTSHGYCPPVTGVSVARGRSIIEKFLRDHPERLKTQAGILAGLALGEAFPCGKAK